MGIYMNIDLSKILSRVRQLHERYHYSSLPETLRKAYEKEMLLRLSWNTNHLEGNTLSLDETIDVIEYDEVRSGHTYSEYREAKSAFRANRDLLDFSNPVNVDLTYISRANAKIMDSDGSFRTGNVYIGTLAEQAYVPPSPDRIPKLMQDYIQKLSEAFPGADTDTVIKNAAIFHMEFEKIHPFADGNGRCGRLFLCQLLLNAGLVPVLIENHSRYRQAFRYYERNGDASLMEYCIASGICSSYEILEENRRKLAL